MKILAWRNSKRNNQSVTWFVRTRDRLRTWLGRDQGPWDHSTGCIKALHLEHSSHPVLCKGLPQGACKQNLSNIRSLKKSLVKKAGELANITHQHLWLTALRATKASGARTELDLLQAIPSYLYLWGLPTSSFLLPCKPGNGRFEGGPVTT